MLTCSRKTDPLSSILLFTARHCSPNFDISTIFHDILHDLQPSLYIDPHDSTFCYCAPAGVSETTPCRNWITPSWPFRAAKCAGITPSPSAAFKVSGTTSWRNWSSPKIFNCKKLHDILNRGTDSLSLSLSSVGRKKHLS